MMCNTDLSLTEELRDEYLELMSAQDFDGADLDYVLLERHKPVLTRLAKVSNSFITVFDMYAGQHVFASDNTADWFGCSLDDLEGRVHPDDVRLRIRNGIEALRFFYSNKEKISEYKLISEYRMRNVSGRYVRVAEQFSVLELDKSGNVWLSLSVLDSSPDQSAFKGVKSNMFNCRTGECFSIPEYHTLRKESGLSLREIKILQLVKDGRLSKEISEELHISVHTVNTHRQRILEKLDVDNSMEAVKYASELGLLA